MDAIILPIIPHSNRSNLPLEPHVVVVGRVDVVVEKVEEFV